VTELHLGKDKPVASSNVASVVGVPHKPLGDKAKTSDPKKAAAGSNLFTEPQSRIRIV